MQISGESSKPGVCSSTPFSTDDDDRSDRQTASRNTRVTDLNGHHNICTEEVNVRGLISLKVLMRAERIAQIGLGKEHVQKYRVFLDLSFSVLTGEGLT